MADLMHNVACMVAAEKNWKFLSLFVNSFPFSNRKSLYNPPLSSLKLGNFHDYTKERY